jgi:hypothetical protein
MKTAMQELIDKIQYSIDVQSGVSLTETQVNTLKAVMLVAENLLEKEKEQIMEAYRYGHIDGFTSANHLGTEFENEEDYYNQTYNQNK